MDINNTSLSSSDPKSQVINEVRQQIAINNARQLISKVNEHCFEKCIPTPGASLSKREEGCFTACMEKYMATWNVVSRQYINRIQRNQQGAGSAVGGFGVPDI